jgi:hypothetical protein
MTQPATTVRGWSIDGFESFWAKPDSSIIPLIHQLATSDIVGHWPRPIGVVRGSHAYIPVIEAILRTCPTLSLSVVEYVRSVDLHFVHWAATGTGLDGPMKFHGVDRLKTNADGRVYENYIFCDHPFFADVAAHLEINPPASRGIHATRHSAEPASN